MTIVLFTVLERHVILRTSNGVFRQVRVAHRGVHVYAQVSTGNFVMLYKDNTTSNPNIRWVEMEGDYAADNFGRLVSTPLGLRVA
jgi:hypothetical protein